MTTTAAARWQIPPFAASDSLASGVPAPLARVLVRRGIDTPEKLSAFLEPPHPLPHSPSSLPGMAAALWRLDRAVNDREPVGVFGDFDVDGITGTAIIAEGLSAWGIPVTPHLPHRVDEGHGLSQAAIDRFADQGISLIITVDTGVTAHEEVAYARTRGVEVIITDHHLPSHGLPDSAAAVNPKLPGGAYPFPELCGAGIAFKLVQGLYEFYGQPWPQNLLELAALGTIADLVPLVDENRYLVTEGVRRLAQTQRPGLRALFNAARVRPGELNSETISFQVVPRLNAAGRMGDPIDSFRILTTDSPDEAGALAHKLDTLNLERRGATQEAYGLACERVEAMEHLPAMLVVADESIARGVAGLVAGRLCERFSRPSVVMAVEQDYAVASGRSIPGFNIVDAIAASQDLVERYGGHAQAAGFTVRRDAIPEITGRLQAYAGERLPTVDAGPVIEIDTEVRLGELTPDVVDWLETLEPFGPGNRRPVFASLGVIVRETRFMGRSQQHLRLLVEQDGVAVTALAFNQAQYWTAGTTRLDLAYTVTIDSWQGAKTLALRVSHFRLAR